MSICVINQICPLCKGKDVREFYQDKCRSYLRCPKCHLIFVPSAEFLLEKEEKARYDTHQNSPDDLRYRQFLSRLFIPLKKDLSSRSCGLDFGSGPGPTLSVMFEEVGYSVAIYDYFYAKDDTVFERQYDFITATEVVEHLHNPKNELDRLWDCLKPGGKLGIMTKLISDHEVFFKWYYKNDPSHVCFFSQQTFKWLEVQWKAKLIFFDKDVMIFHKNREKAGSHYA